MKWLSVFVLLSIGAILLSGGVAYAASPSVDDVKVYQGYEESGDWLIVCTYNISGGNTSDCTNTSCCSMYTYPWELQLTDGSTTVYTNNTIKECGMRVGSIYINLSLASTLTWEGPYSVKVIAKWGTGKNGSRAIGVTDWRGTNLDYLGEWAIEQADIIGAYDGDDFTESVALYDHDVLDITAGAFFDSGIPYMSSHLQEYFLATTDSVVVNYEPSADDNDYAEGLYNDWDTMLGPDISNALTAMGVYFGAGGRLMGAILVIIGFLAIAMIEKSVAFMIILGGILIGVIPMVTVFLLVFILAIVLIRSLFWSST